MSSLSELKKLKDIKIDFNLEEMRNQFKQTINNIKILIDAESSYTVTGTENAMEVKMRDDVYESVSASYNYAQRIITTMKQRTDSIMNGQYVELQKIDDSAIKFADSIEDKNRNIRNNTEVLDARNAQYQLAIERNAHRRKMVIMLAILNTLFLLIYYFVSK
jgi:hypothetical protein